MEAKSHYVNDIAYTIASHEKFSSTIDSVLGWSNLATNFCGIWTSGAFGDYTRPNPGVDNALRWVGYAYGTSISAYGAYELGGLEIAAIPITVAVATFARAIGRNRQKNI